MGLALFLFSRSLGLLWDDSPAGPHCKEPNMATIIRGTTPTLKYTFKSVQVSDISVAFLTIKQADEIIVRKALDAAVVGDGSISWTLTQTETLAVAPGQAEAMINWRTSDGTRGASFKTIVAINRNHIEEVI